MESIVKKPLYKVTYYKTNCYRYKKIVGKLPFKMQSGIGFVVNYKASFYQSKKNPTLTIQSHTHIKIPASLTRGLQNSSYSISNCQIYEKSYKRLITMICIRLSPMKNGHSLERQNISFTFYWVVFQILYLECLNHCCILYVYKER